MTDPHQPPPDGLYQELLWVHTMIRRDLRTVEGLAEAVRNGAPPADIASGIASLETEGPLWKLRANCLYYCRFVHQHHTLEDVTLFPALRMRDPSLAPVVDRLERDHLQVADLLAEISAGVRELGKADSTHARSTLFSTLSLLGEHLLEHLSYEERSLADVLETMTMADLTQGQVS